MPTTRSRRQAAQEAEEAEIKKEDTVKEEEPESVDDEEVEEESEMTEYERKRRENIQRNLELMRSLGVSTAKIAARTAISDKPSKPLKASKSLSLKRKQEDAPVAPQRRSKRLQGEKADGAQMVMSHDSKLVAAKSEEEAQELKLGPHVKAEDVRLTSGDGQGLLASITDGIKSVREQEADLGVDSSGMELVDYDLDEEDIVRATQERVYSVAFHPTTSKTVVACGDKGGRLSLWNADAAADDDNVVAMYRPHTLPLTRLYFNDQDSTKLVSCSFDGTAREFDLNAGEFNQVFEAPEEEGISYLAADVDKQRYVMSGHDGHAFAVDRRDSSKNVATYLLHDKKINTIHQHPTLTHCWATASLDRTVQLWDSRKLRKEKNTPLATLPHYRSVNCAYFSPNGDHLVTVCQDDHVYVYDTHAPVKKGKEDVSPSLSIPHNNKTGQWLTKIHASWHPRRHKEFVIGSMQQPRRIQIFQATRKKPIQELTSELFKSVHSVNVFHPTLDLLVGGNSSGRLALWRPMKK